MTNNMLLLAWVLSFAPPEPAVEEVPAEPTQAAPVDTAPPAAEQRQVPDNRLESLLERDLLVPSTTRTELVSSRSAALGDINSVTAPDDFSVAVQTNLEGVEAGVVVSPLAFSPSIPVPARGFHVLAASLADQNARWGVGYSIVLPTPKTLTLADVGLSYCPVDEAKLRAQVSASENDFKAVCENFVAKLDPNDQVVKNAIDACFGPQFDEDMTLVSVLGWIALLIEEQPRAALDVKENWKALSNITVDRGLDCWTSSKNVADLDQAVRRYEWTHLRVRLGGRYTEDRKVRLWGFNPDTTSPLSKGEVFARHATLEVNFQYARLMLSASGGYYWGQVPISDKKMENVQGAEIGGTLAMVLFAVDGKRLLPKGDLRAPAGKLPPHVAGGATLRTVLLTTRPSSQANLMDEFEVVPYLDFIATDKLRFRVGAPIRATTKLRAQDVGMGVTEKRALQWSVSPLILTVLKI